jgi:PAS domain S-box-containing protein
METQNTAEEHDESSEACHVLVVSNASGQQKLEAQLGLHGICTCCLRVSGVAELAGELVQGSWDLVLADCDALSLDGGAVVRAVAAADREVPVILLVGSRSVDDALALLRCGAWDVVPSGEPDRLVSAIARCLRDGAALRARQADVRALRESEEHYRLLAECSDDIVVIHHVDGRRLYLSPSYWRVTGWTPDELLVVDWRQRVHPEDLPAVERARAANLRGEPTNIEHRALCKDGSWLWIEARCRPLLGADGKVERMLLWSRNITDRKSAEAKHGELQRQLFQAQKLEAVGRLAGGVAHDFNNMLQTILGTTELLMRDMPPDDSRVEDLQEIERAAQRSADLTRQLLAFARKQTITPKTLDLNQAVTDMLKMLRRLIGEDIELVWRPAPKLWPVRMDPSQLDQILANLMVHSREVIAGTGRVMIETEQAVVDEGYCREHPDAAPGEYVALVVRDNGRVLSREEQARIFEPFYSAKGDGVGAGLGLATVYGIVKQNRGMIAVDSVSGLGTSFKLYLPRQAETDGSGVRSDRPLAVPGGSVTVLLVEDEAPLLRLARRLLEALGYCVLCAGGPQEALRVAAEHAGEIHMLLTDVIMPDMDGHELLQLLGEVRPRIKCLFMSGYPADAIAHCGVLEPGLHLIQKPFTKNALGQKLQDVLAAHAG